MSNEHDNGVLQKGNSSPEPPHGSVEETGRQPCRSINHPSVTADQHARFSPLQPLYDVASDGLRAHAPRQEFGLSRALHFVDGIPTEYEPGCSGTWACRCSRNACSV